jgi:hypothetical protein
LRGNPFSGDKTAINFFASTGENILIGHCFGDLYYILSSIAYAKSANATMEENIWHLHLGHPGVQPLRDLAKSGTIPLKLDAIKREYNCITCATSK